MAVRLFFLRQHWVLFGRGVTHQFWPQFEILGVVVDHVLGRQEGIDSQLEWLISPIIILEVPQLSSYR
jgi:hypothetical protein